MLSLPVSDYSFKVITYILSLTLCAVLSFSLFPQMVMVSAVETGVSSTVTEETAPTETLSEDSVQELDCGILDTQEECPRDQDDNF